MKNFKAIIQVFKITFNKIISNPKYYALPLIVLVLLLKKKLLNLHKIISNPKYYALPLIVLVLLLKKKLLNLHSSQSNTIIRKKTTLSEFLKKINQGTISKVLVKKNNLYFLSNDNILHQTTHSLFPKNQLFDRLIKGNVTFQTISTSFNASRFLTALIISATITFVLSYFFTDIFSFKVQKVKKADSTFKDIVGLQDCKIALKEVIQFMKDSSNFKESGARMRRGIVFYGPSGTGKTSLAKACAGQANVPFFSCNAAQFRQMYVGVGAKKVRQLFKKARQNAPSIIYIDQIDAMGNRSNGLMQNFDGASSQKNSTINQLLSQMDGFSSSQMILVIGSTNKLDYIDSALLRPGRFDLKLKVNLPNQRDRLQILQHYLTNKKHNLQQAYLKQTVFKLKGWSGADLQNLANQSVYTSLRRKSPAIQQQDIQNTLKILL